MSTERDQEPSEEVSSCDTSTRSSWFSSGPHCSGAGGRGSAGRHHSRHPVKPVYGQIKSIKIDRCGLQPGTCEGSVIWRTGGSGGHVRPFQSGPG